MLPNKITKVFLPDLFQRKRGWLARLLGSTILALVSLVLFASVIFNSVHIPTVSFAVNLSFPIRAAFYYPWFPESWNQQGYNPFTNYHPTLGYYSINSVISSQIQAMQYAGIQASIASWWGQGSATDGRITNLLQATHGKNFYWTLYYEPEGLGDPSVAQIQSDLSYINSHYSADSNFLHVNGKPVIFVYADGADGCGMTDRWIQANGGSFYVVLKVFSGYAACSSQPDNWHQYGPAVAKDHQGTHSFTISPGFYKKGESSSRLPRDPNIWNTNIKDMLSSGANWQLITTFNEWGEGTSIEDATEWDNCNGYGIYLDELHTNGNGQPACLAVTTPSPPPSQSNNNTQTSTAQPTSSKTTTTTNSTPTTATKITNEAPISQMANNVSTGLGQTTQKGANLLGIGTLLQDLSVGQIPDNEKVPAFLLLIAVMGVIALACIPVVLVLTIVIRKLQLGWMIKRVFNKFKFNLGARLHE